MTTCILWLTGSNRFWKNLPDLNRAAPSNLADDRDEDALAGYTTEASLTGQWRTFTRAASIVHCFKCDTIFWIFEVGAKRLSQSLLLSISSPLSYSLYVSKQQQRTEKKERTADYLCYSPLHCQHSHSDKNTQMYRLWRRGGRTHSRGSCGSYWRNDQL